jgi:predicted NACHT family NTPase
MLVLREIAYTFHLRKSRELSRDFLCHNAIPEILSEMHFSRSVDASPSDVLQNIEERSQLLTERGLDPTGKPLMAFSHLTFQEYLASMHFKERIAVDGESRVSDDLVERYEADPEWWEEVVLLYAAQLEGIRQKRFFERIDRMSAT